MAANDITVGGVWATIEADSTKHEITITNANGVLINIGDQSVFLSMEHSGASLLRDGAQRVGEIELAPGDSVALPGGTPFVENQCISAESSKLWWIPTIA